MQTPFWLPIWQAAASLLSVATEVTVVLPVMVLLCLLLGRRRQREAMGRTGQLFLHIALVTAFFGAVDIAGHGFVSLQAIPASMDKLVPVPFDPFSLPWRATCTSLASWALGGLCLGICALFARPIFRTAAFSMDEDTLKGMDKKALAASAAALVAFACFFAAIILRNWPFLGLPEQMTQETVFQVLLKHSWRQSCAALMPAGGIAVFSLFLQLPGLSREQKQVERENRRQEVIPGTVPETLPLSDVESTAFRMCAAFALAGATFQLLDAGFLAFSSVAALGSGFTSALMRFGPFLVTAGSLACWAFIFVRPRRNMLFLALLPVLLILLRAVGRF